MSDTANMHGHVDTSEWNHIKCGSCREWFAIEGKLKQSHFFCPHCGIRYVQNLYTQIIDMLSRTSI